MCIWNTDSKGWHLFLWISRELLLLAICDSNIKKIMVLSEHECIFLFEMSVLQFFMVVIWLSSTHLKPNFQRKRSQHILFKSNFQCDISENWFLFLVLLDTSVICNTVGVIITCLSLYESYFLLAKVFNQLPCVLLFGILVVFICIFFPEISVTGLFIVKTIMFIERFILYLDWKRSWVIGFLRSSTQSFSGLQSPRWSFFN